MMTKYGKFVSFVLILVILGAGIFVGRRSVSNMNQGDTATTNENSAKYPLLSKRIFINNPNDVILNFSKLRADLNAYFEKEKLDGGVYFEYLPTGTSIRISDDSQEVAASLMKLPLSMELYKMNENGTLKLSDMITLQEGWLDGAYGDLYKKGAGYSLSYKEAADIMLKKSDNTALKAIAISTIGKLSNDDRVLNSLDVDYKQNTDLTVSISSKSYSSILKCLYFSCYLNRNDSQEILDILTKTNFNDRIVAGISNKKIKVAHKFGVASQITQSDCGIVYLEKRNYIFCALLNEDNDPKADSHIAALSKLTYDFLAAQ